MAKKRKEPVHSKMTTEQEELIEAYKSNPILAAQHLLIRNDKPLKLAPHQRIILKGMWTLQFVLLILTRAGSKTFVMALFAILKAMLFPREKIVITSASYRQAKYVMDEIQRFYDESPLLREACTKPMSRLPEQCELEFVNGSKIIAYPLGDGGKIRGARGTRLIVDEVAQVPKEIIDVVLLPLLNASQDPMNKDPERQGNSLILASSAYYQFNHLYERYQLYLKRTDPSSPEYDDSYGLFRFSYLDMPDGWMNEKIIAEAKATLTRGQFLMEYCCEFLSDSEGFFPASLVRSIAKNSIMIEPEGERGGKYVLGVDPARTGDNFALCVIKLGMPNKLVAMYTLNRQTFPYMHDFIRNMYLRYSKNGGEVVRIQMDLGGGGQTLKDLLAQEWVYYNTEKGKYESMQPIIDIDDESLKYAYGKRILRMQVFSSQNITQMNYDLKADMEKQKILVPATALNGTEEEENILDEVNKMKDEIMTIVSTPLNNGYFRFDTPSKNMHKDRYSAFLIGVQGARELTRDGNGQKKLATGFVKRTSLSGRGFF